MDYQRLMDIGIYAGIALFALLVLGAIFAKLYTRASKEVSFVRTGFSGQKVIMNGGAMVVPVLHEVIPVNMNTLQLDVRRTANEALITKDRMRVDVGAEFYVRVQPTEESIANAAQTLGRKTMAPEELKALIEGKFVDALRSVAAEMGMEELHEQRTAFVQKVQQVVSEDLLKNGLELEAVSLTGLDQTSREYFNPDNAFDAEGLTKLTEAIEMRRKKRNEIEQDTEVAVRMKNLQAVQQKLTLEKEEEMARINQQREIEMLRATQLSEIEREKSLRAQEAEQAKIAAQQQVEQTRLESQRIVEEQRLEMERQVREREVAKARAVEQAELEKRKTLELSEQDRAIAVAEKSKAQSEAQRLADAARAEAVRAAEAVITAKEAEIAEREKRIELIEAAKQAERQAIAVTTAAEAEKQAAMDQAEAMRTLAEAKADQVRIGAKAQADAALLAAAAEAKRYEVDAAGKRAINEAANVMTVDQIAMQVKLAIIAKLPEILRESVKPLERIEGIKIVQVDGLNAGGGGSGDAAPASGNLGDQVVSAALRYRAQAPLIESILKEVGMSGADLAGLAAPAHDLLTPPPGKE